MALRKFVRRHTMARLLGLLAVAMSFTKCVCDSPARFHYDVEFKPADNADVGNTQHPLKSRRKKPAKPEPGDVIVFGGATGFTKTVPGVEFYDPHTQKWTSTTPLPQSDAGAQGTELNLAPLIGQILVGQSITGKVTFPKFKLTIAVKPVNAQIFNPANSSFKSVGNLLDPRTGYTQTLLPSGKVLVAGGIDVAIAPTKRAELFDPATGTFTATGDMSAPRALHTATLLGDGSVFIAGGLTDNSNDTLDTAEIYEPDTGKFAELPAAMPVFGGIAGHTATLISGCSCALDGWVLIAGGYNGFAGAQDTATNTAILYDPNHQSFSSPGQMTDSRVFHTATALINGKVLIAGGIFGQASVTSSNAFGIFGGVLNSAEVFDPSTQTFSCVNGSTAAGCKGSMTNSRAGHMALLINSGPLAGQVLLAGGMGGTAATTGGKASPLKTAELYNPASGFGHFNKTASMKSARTGFAAVLLQ